MSGEAQEREGWGAFQVPARRHRVEETIRGSRFITSVARTRDEAEARAFVQEISQEFSDATHNCWAFVAGPPGETARIGLSDDGEPHGTAGRPMLETLLHSQVGEICAVTTRYYGGTKLGRGGLGRAYAGGVNLALESLPTAEKVDRTPVRIRVEYAAVDPLFRLLEALGAVREGEEYGEDVEVTAAVPTKALQRLRREVAQVTSGQGEVAQME
jgi:uncharacterized YigZ family protein